MNPFPLHTAFAALACLVSTALSSRALDVTTVVEFSGKGGSNMGANSTAGLVSDGAGNLWGTTSKGGAADFGTVFKVAQATGALTTVVEFDDNGPSNKGRYPYAGLVSDGAGNLWGTTNVGGAASMGTVFKIAEATGTLTTVVEFTGNSPSNKGQYPREGLVSDGVGNFWGTTESGGAKSKGTVFKIGQATGALTTVIEFTGDSASNKGWAPSSVLVDDGVGNFWGTTSGGDAPKNQGGTDGTVFKIAKATGLLTTVLEFTGNGTSNKGSHPKAALVGDGTGNFWGTTELGGENNMGTVFKIVQATGALTTLVEFTGNGASNKGSGPKAALASDGTGNFWGTTQFGGTNNAGTVFKIAQATGVLTTVVEFTGNSGKNKGGLPIAGLVNDGAGNFWGTTKFGGTSKSGTVFKIAAGLAIKP